MNTATRLEALKNTERARLVNLGVTKVELQLHRLVPVEEWRVGVYFHIGGKRIYQEGPSYYTDDLKDARDTESAIESFYQSMGFEVILNPSLRRFNE